MREHFITVDRIAYTHAAKSVLPRPVLKNISFQVSHGEFVAIVGANGSGKTTLARHLNALLIPTSGSVHISGLDTRDRTNHLRIHQKVGLVFQSPQDQMIATSVEEDVAFGLENLGLPTSQIRQRVKESLKKVNMWDQRQRPPHQLSAGQMQRVALAGIIAMQSECIIFDESTAMLDPMGRQEVLDSISRLKANGVTVIMITHSMEEACLADRVLGLNQGSLHFDGTPAELFNNNALVKSMNLDKPRVLWFAQQLKPWIPEINCPLTITQFEQQLNTLPVPRQFSALDDRHFFRNRGELLVKGEDISFSYLKDTPLAYQALRKVDFEIRQGSIHGLIGGTGAGKSTLLQHLNGLYLPQTGKLQVGRFKVDSEVDILALRRFTGMVFQNPNYQIFEQYVGDEIAYGLKLLETPREELRQRVKEAMEKVGLDFEEFKDRQTLTLSGGEKRKVALASILVLNPELLLLDEPTAGLDPLARREVLIQMVQLHREGKTIVVSSHQLEDHALLTDHVTLLNQGEVVSTLESDQMLSNHTLLNNHHMIAPIAAQMAEVLRQKGWLLPENIIIWRHLLAAFQSLEPEHG